MSYKELTAVTLLVLIITGLSMAMGPGSSGQRHQYVSKWLHEEVVPHLLIEKPSSIPARGIDPYSGCQVERIPRSEFQQKLGVAASQVNFLPELGLYELILPLTGGEEFLWIRVPRELADRHVPYLQLKKNLILLLVTLFGLAAVISISWADRQNQRAIQEKERAEILQRLARGLAHEIRNPLNALGLSARMLSEAPDPDGDRQRYARMLKAEIHRLDSILNRFSDWSREIHPERIETPLRLLTGSVIELFQAEAAGQQLRLQFEDGPAVEAAVDPEMIRQILVNLVKNALEASPAGEVIRVSLTSSRTIVDVAVQDAGPGIPVADREKIFEYYYTTRTQGQGIGLALARKLARAHGGDVVVDSRPGKTVFTLRLPLKGTV